MKPFPAQAPLPHGEIHTLIAFTHYRSGKYRFGIFKRKREKKIMVMLMLPK